MSTSDYIRASNGEGEAVRAFITEPRAIGDMSIITDSVLNWPHTLIGTTGTLDEATGLIDPDTATIFYGHLDGSIVMIDEFAPGYSDEGNTTDQVVLLKPTTAWADKVADALDNIKAITVSDTAPVTPKADDFWLDESTSGGTAVDTTSVQTLSGKSFSGDVNVTGDIYSNSKKVITEDDTGWIKLSLTGMVDYSAGTGPRIRRIGNVVQIAGQMKPTSTSGSVYFATVPADCCPDPALFDRLVFVCQGSGNDRWSLSVYASSGLLLFERYSGTVSTSTWLPMSVTYFVG